MFKLAPRCAVTALIGLGLLAVGGPAYANRTSVDGSPSPFTACTLGGAACVATPIGFGPFSSIFVYNNGLVSIGSSIDPGANLSSLATIGGSVFTPGYSPTRGLFSSFNIQGPQPDLADGLGGSVVRVTLCFSADCRFDDQTEQFSIFDLGSGQYALSFNYGASNTTDPPVFPADAYAGYSIGGMTVQRNGTDLQAAVTRLDPFVYRFSTSTTPGVPEPSIWAMLLLGFGGIGVALRQDRHRRGVLATA